MFGGSGGRESRPQYVPNEWSVATEFLKDAAGAVGVLVRLLVAVACWLTTKVHLPKPLRALARWVRACACSASGRESSTSESRLSSISS